MIRQKWEPVFPRDKRESARAEIMLRQRMGSGSD
jgi:hypothetical protein